MARRPGQGGRPRHGVHHLLRCAVALGGGPVDALLLHPLRMMWRALPSLRSRKARRASAAAIMARRHWRADAPPRATSLLRRTVARAGGAFDAALLPGRRALAALHRSLSLSLQRALAFVRRLLRPRRHCRVPRAWRRHCREPRAWRPPSLQQQPPKNGAWNYWPCTRRPRPPATSTPPPASRPRKIFSLDGEVNLYKEYCTLPCPPMPFRPFCVFEMQRAPNFTVPTSNGFTHCSQVSCSVGGALCPLP